MLAIRAFVGDIILQTGQALQRSGLRAGGHQVHMPLKYKSMGLTPLYYCNSVDIHESSFISGEVLISPDVIVGKHTVIRAETDEIYVGFAAQIGANCVITSLEPKLTFEETRKELPKLTEIGEAASIGDDCVINNAMIGKKAVVGKGTVVGYGAIVENNAVVKENSVVPPGTKIPMNQTWGGSPIIFISENDEHH